MHKPNPVDDRKTNAEKRIGTDVFLTCSNSGLSNLHEFEAMDPEKVMGIVHDAVEAMQQKIDREILNPFQFFAGLNTGLNGSATVPPTKVDGPRKS